MKSVFRRIVEENGIDVLEDGQRFIAILSDYAPNMKKERKFISDSFSIGVNKIILKANDGTAGEKRVALLKARYLIKEKLGLATEHVDMVISCFAAILASKTFGQNIAVDIGGSGVRTGIISANGVDEIRWESVGSLEELTDAIKQRSPSVDGIALSVPGFIHGESGYVSLNTVAPYLQGKLKENIESVFPHAEVFVVNDGEAHALALLNSQKIELGAINFSLGTSVGFGALNEMGQVVRSLSGENWDVGDLQVDAQVSMPYAWYALGQNGLKELLRTYGDRGYEVYGSCLGRFASQLAVIFRPKTIGFSGGITVNNWSRIEKTVNNEFTEPVNSSVRLIAQKDNEAALAGLSTFFRY